MSNIKFIEGVFSEFSNEKVESLKVLFERKIEKLGISYRQIETILGIERKTISNILNNETQKVSVTNLIKIGTFLDMSFSDVLKVFAAQIPKAEISEIERAIRLTYIIEHFDLKSLKTMGFIPSITDLDSVEKRIKTFFGIENIFNYSKEIGAAFSKVNKNYNNRMLDFWNKSAFAFFEKINNPNRYDREKLIQIIPNIRPYSQDIKKGLRIVSRALFELGVTVAFQPYLPTTQVRGATFVVNEKPCIVITNRNKNYATLWFALMHELYHVLFELEKVERSVFHLTGELNLEFVDEQAANSFARRYFLSDEKSRYIFPYIKDEVIINRYANKNKIHPSLIYNFYCYDQQHIKKKNFWGLYNKYMPGTDDATKNLNSDIWGFSTIEEGVLSTINLTTTTK